MRATLSILAGLVVGAAVAGLVLVGIIAFAPDPVVSSTPAPSLVIESASPAASPSPTPVVSPAPSASALDVTFHVWVDEGVVPRGRSAGSRRTASSTALESIVAGVDGSL